MTVSSVVTKSGPYTGNGTTTNFGYDFTIQSDTWLKVWVTDSSGTATLQTLGTDYTVNGVGSDTGREVVFTTAPASGTTVLILSNYPYTQLTDFVNQGSFDPQIHEDALDKLTHLAQQLLEITDRSLTLPEPSTGVSTELPTPTAGYLIGWDDPATQMVNVSPDAFDVGARTYATVSDMKAASISAGVLVRTKGYYAAGDGGQATYLTKTAADYGAAPDEYGDHTLANGNVAVLQHDGAVNAKQFGAKGDFDGVTGTDDTAAIQAALNSGANIFIPKGAYLIPSSVGLLVPSGDTVIYGESSENCIIQFDNVNYDAKPCLHGTNPVDRLEIRNIGIVGQFGVTGGFSEKRDLINLANVSDLYITGCKFEGSFSGSLVVQECDKALVTNCVFNRSYRDACRIMNGNQVTISNNMFRDILDDSIAVSTYDTSSVKDNTINISDNTLIDSQGIVSLGGKRVVISNNVITRAMHRAIKVGASPDYDTGNTPILSITISGNIITDLFKGTLFSPSSGATVRGIEVYTDTLIAEDVVETLVGTEVVSPYPYLYSKDTDVDTTSSINAGNYGVTIIGNTVARTLSAASAYSDYGFGQRLSRDGYVDPPVALSDIQADQLYLFTSGNGLLVACNQLSGGDRAIRMVPGEAANGVAFRNYNIARNIISNFNSYGIAIVGDGHVKIFDNTIDGDPYHDHPDRTVPLDGTWTTAITCIGIGLNTAATLTAELSGNTFKNLGTPVTEASANLALWHRTNTIHCDPVSRGDNASNIGIRNVPHPAIVGTVVIEDGNPVSPTFKNVLNICHVSTVGLPTTGKYIEGHFVLNGDSASPNVGYRRVTTGTGHVMGTDWVAV